LGLGFRVQLATVTLKSDDLFFFFFFFFFFTLESLLVSRLFHSAWRDWMLCCSMELCEAPRMILVQICLQIPSLISLFFPFLLALLHLELVLN
jgi:hypothetical protein